MSMNEIGASGEPLAAPTPNEIPSPQIGAEPIRREIPTPDNPRAVLVKNLCEWAKETKAFRSKRFAKMRRDIAFVRPGKQWRSQSTQDTVNEEVGYNDKYEANIVQRHVQQRVAALYAKNPKVVAKRRKRLDFKYWDGTQKSLMEALSRAQGVPPSPGDPMAGEPPNPGVAPAPTPEDVQLLLDLQEGMDRRKMLDKISKTAEILFAYFMQEGTPTFKSQAKQLVRRVVTTGVGFIQLGFQRMMKSNPEITNRIRDDQERIKHLETLAANQRDGIVDGERSETEAKIEELRVGLTALQAQEQIVLREGLVFDFPRSTDILVDKDCVQLKGFVGARRVAREYHYTRDQITSIFKVDVGSNYTQYSPTKTWEPAPNDRRSEANVACVWAIWDALDGVVYYVCDGYPDFLKEPEPPEVTVDGFFPLKVLSFNDIEDEHDIYPPSDVELVRPMQLEYNRSREGLREHRISNKPGYVAARGMLDDESKTALQNHEVAGLIELNVTPDAVKEVDKYIRPRPTVEIRPEVYDVEGVFQDFQRVAGEQSANLGGVTGDVTATEASIAETSRVSSLQSCIDDVNDFLSDMARAGGQVMFAEMSPQQVEKIVGPGAVWPDFTREEIAEEIYLEIEAGSSGRPNKAVELANWERLMPFLVQIPRLSQEWLLRESIKRLDENVDIEDAFEMASPSVVATNAMASAAGKQLQPGTGKANDPKAQGPKGASKDAPEPAGVKPSQPGPRPNYPTLDQPPA